MMNTRNYLQKEEMPEVVMVNKKNNIYYNITIPHNISTNSDGSPSPATFIQVRNEPLLRGPASNFVLSIVRFAVPMSAVPIQLFPIQPAPANLDINKSTYGIAVSWNGNDYDRQLEWITQNDVARVPPTPAVGNDVNVRFAPYYSLKSIQHLLDLINTQLADIMLAMIVDGWTGNTAPPFFYFDSVSNLIKLYCPRDWADAGLGTEPKLYMNTELYDNFQTSFETKVINYTATSPNQNFQLVIKDLYINNEDLPAPYGVNTLAIKQEYNGTMYLSSLASVVFTTNSIPVRSEWITGQTASGALDSLSESYLQIITDFEVQVENLGSIRSYVNYFPPGEYRRTSLDSDGDINVIDLNIFVKDKKGNLYPLLIPKGEVATMKILFEER